MANKYLDLAGLEHLWDKIEDEVGTAADNAKTEAIASAAADATTKANNALSSAKTDTDNKLKSYLPLSGIATAATKLSNTTAIGSATQPVYFSADGVPVATTYTLGTSVPSGAVFTDEKVKISTSNPTDSATYYPTWVTAAGTSGVGINNGLRYFSLEGTTTTDGYGILSVGNAATSGTAGNKTGMLRIYSKKAYYTNLKANESLTNDNTIVLPATPGTLALTTDITDEKVKLSVASPTDTATYYQTLHNATTGTTSLSTNAAIKYYLRTGSATSAGMTQLVLGNNTASGTAGNQYGQISLYSTGTNYHTIIPATGNSNANHTLPATTGTILNTGTTSFTQTLTSGTEVGKIKINGTTTTLYAPTNTDTHYTTGLKVGASATATANAAATNGNVYLNVLDNTTVRDSHNIVGTGATTVTSDANGKITISSTNTTYSKLSQFTNDSGYITGITKDMVTTALGYTPPTTNTTYSAMTGATASAAGKAGLVPAPAAGKQTSFLRGDGTWVVPTNTTYSVVSKTANGLCPQLPNETTTTKYLRQDGTWVTPPNTTYSAATTSANGLMSSTDKTKLDNTNVAYGTCSTAAGTAAKVITISGNTNWSLKAGSIIVIKFSATNSAQNPTFNVNNTGAKSVWYNTALITTGSLSYAGTANRPMKFVYDGTQYVFMGWSLDNNSDTKVTQTLTSTNANYPLLLAPTGQTATTTTTALFSTGVQFNPSTKELSGITKISSSSTGSISITGTSAASLSASGLASVSATAVSVTGSASTNISGGGKTISLNSNGISANSKFTASNLITGTRTITVTTANALASVTLTSTDLGFTPTANTSVVMSVRKSSSPSPLYFNTYSIYYNNSLYLYITYGANSSTKIDVGTYYIDYIVTNNS